MRMASRGTCALRWRVRLWQGYYDNTMFHRIIAKFMVQGGDPTGTGQVCVLVYRSLSGLRARARVYAGLRVRVCVHACVGASLFHYIF
jgi:hypothetical protein